MTSSASALSILTAMITPAVLISACGTLLLSTSHRIVRVIDRVHDWSARLEAMARDPAEAEFDRELRLMVIAQLDATARRARLLRWSMTAYYLAVGLFVADIIAIGLVTLIHVDGAWLTVGLGMLGAAVLLGGSMTLIAEAHIALITTQREMVHLRRIGHRHLPPRPPGCRGRTAPEGSAH